MYNINGDHGLPILTTLNSIHHRAILSTSCQLDTRDHVHSNTDQEAAKAATEAHGQTGQHQEPTTTPAPAG